MKETAQGLGRGLAVPLQARAEHEDRVALAERVAAGQAVREPGRDRAEGHEQPDESRPGGRDREGGRGARVGHSSSPASAPATTRKARIAAEGHERGHVQLHGQEPEERSHGRARRAARGERRAGSAHITKSGASTSVIVESSLMRTCSEGPAVSLKGSPTVSPTTAALWALRLLPHHHPVHLELARLDVLLGVVPGPAAVVHDGGHEDAGDGADHEHGRHRLGPDLAARLTRPEVLEERSRPPPARAPPGARAPPSRAGRRRSRCRRSARSRACRFRP